MTNTLNLSWLATVFASTANTTQFWPIFGASGGQHHTGGAPDTTEANLQTLMRSAGTLSNMWIRITANSIAATPSITINSRVNSGAGNQQVKPGTTATGTFTDSTHTDVLSAGAKVALQTIPGAATNTFTPSINSFIFAATTNTVSRLTILMGQGLSGGQFSTGTSTFYALTGDETSGALPTEAHTKCRQQKAGTFQNACINIPTGDNQTTGASTLKGRINGSATGVNISISITAGAVGFFEDTSHTDAVTVGQDYDLNLTVGTGGSLGVNTNQIDFASTTGDCQLVSFTDTAQTVLKSVTTNTGLGGCCVVDTTELHAEAVAGAAFTFSNLSILVSANTVSATSTLTLRANAASPGSGPVVSITASTAQLFADTTHTYVAASSDLVDTQLVTGGTGTSLAFFSTSIWGTLAAGAVTTTNPQFFTTKPDIRQLNPMFANAPVMFAT